MSTAHCFSTLHTNHSWPHRADGDKSDDLNPRHADVIENVWNTAFEQRQSSRIPDLQRRIHILGVGAIGLLIAHSLAGIPNRPPITFLVNSRATIRRFRESGGRVELITDGISDIRGGFDIEHGYTNVGFTRRYPSAVSPDPQIHDRVDTASRYRLADGPNAAKDTSAPKPVLPIEKSLVGEQTSADDGTLDASRDAIDDEAVLSDAEQGTNYLPSSLDDQGFISNLVVALKTKDILDLSCIAHRLTKESVILFLQNGMGFIEEVNEKIFPDPQTRPTYIVGIVTHGAKRASPYTVLHAGHGTIALGVLPRLGAGPTHSLSPSARYLLRTITRTPVLAAVAYEPTEILQYRLERLAIDCVVDPLTAIMECTNGQLLHNIYINRMMRLVLAEISLVLRSLPELQNVPHILSRFDPGRLEMHIFNVAAKTSQNDSPMLQDVRAGLPTDISYLNGYVIRKGEELGIRCVMNYMLMQMVNAKQRIVARSDSERLPLGSQNSLMPVRR